MGLNIDKTIEKLKGEVNVENYFHLSPKKRKEFDKIIYNTILKKVSKGKLTKEDCALVFKSMMLRCEKIEEFIYAGIFKNILENIETYYNEENVIKTIKLKMKNPD